MICNIWKRFEINSINKFTSLARIRNVNPSYAREKKCILVLHCFLKLCFFLSNLFSSSDVTAFLKRPDLDIEYWYCNLWNFSSLCLVIFVLFWPRVINPSDCNFCVLLEDAPLKFDTILHFKQHPFVFTKIYLNNGHCFQEWIEFGWMLQENLCLGSKQVQKSTLLYKFHTVLYNSKNDTWYLSKVYLKKKIKIPSCLKCDPWYYFFVASSICKYEFWI